MSNTISSIPVSSPFGTGSTGLSRGQDAGQSGFGDVLRGAIGQSEQLDKDSQQQVASLLQGDGQNVHSVMIAVEKADIAFQMMMQVRNKVVNAYQEISRLQF